jgi:antitoxin component YwqK of YwqJK toxin-antitoxin module
MKRLEGKYVSGEKNGRWKRYYDDGQLMLEIDYKRGDERKLNGKTIKPKS